MKCQEGHCMKVRSGCRPIQDLVSLKHACHEVNKRGHVFAAGKEIHGRGIATETQAAGTSETETRGRGTNVEVSHSVFPTSASDPTPWSFGSPERVLLSCPPLLSMVNNLALVCSFTDLLPHARLQSSTLPRFSHRHQ